MYILDDGLGAAASSKGHVKKARGVAASWPHHVLVHIKDHLQHHHHFCLSAAVHLWMKYCNITSDNINFNKKRSGKIPKRKTNYFFLVSWSSNIFSSWNITANTMHSSSSHISPDEVFVRHAVQAVGVPYRVCLHHYPPRGSGCHRKCQQKRPISSGGWRTQLVGRE